MLKEQIHQIAEECMATEDREDVSNCEKAIGMALMIQFEIEAASTPSVEEMVRLQSEPKLNQRDRWQMATAWRQIMDTGNWMLEKINHNVQSTYTVEFDMLHRLRHSLRDVYGIVGVLLKRGHTHYNPKDLPTKCHVCKAPTDVCCADCAITLGASVYVCGKTPCMDEHKKVCPHELRKRYVF